MKSFVHCICSEINLSHTGSRTKQNLDLNRVPLHLFSLSAFTSLSIASAETHRHCYLLVAASVAKQHSPQLYFSFPSLSMAPQRGSRGRGRRAYGSGTSAFLSPSPLVRNSSACAPSHASVCLCLCASVCASVGVQEKEDGPLPSGDEGEEAWEISE
ncbi:hypothetical protein Cgig2_013360 [Carnegiea gigantea]|uniref:Uncharacterized protein n=1 Tax=Carnegiea gigantea TaxID=171969 RepID=A0A9Q1GPA8_9CARY|nr:hypothetical protein Cgig2_013360 [Carnegiea gigantea]